MTKQIKMVIAEVSGRFSFVKNRFFLYVASLLAAARRFKLPQSFLFAG
jgi:hypothetical protein